MVNLPIKPSFHERSVMHTDAQLVAPALELYIVSSIKFPGSATDPINGTAKPKMTQAGL